MMPAITVRDTFENLTVLYHKGCQQAFKFFGDDPEEHKVYVKEHHVDMIKQMFDTSKYPWEFLTRFYLHSRCLLFTDGVWMSETATYPQYLRYKPGSHTSMRVSGITRFTALTNNCGAICVGWDPDADHIPNLRREVHRVDKETHFMPMRPDSILVATEDAMYGSIELPMGCPRRVINDFDVLQFEKPGYLIEFMNEPMVLEDELINYAHQWISGRIEVFDRA